LKINDLAAILLRSGVRQRADAC